MSPFLCLTAWLIWYSWYKTKPSEKFQISCISGLPVAPSLKSVWMCVMEYWFSFKSCTKSSGLPPDWKHNTQRNNTQCDLGFESVSKPALTQVLLSKATYKRDRIQSKLINPGASDRSAASFSFIITMCHSSVSISQHLLNLLKQFWNDYNIVLDVVTDTLRNIIMLSEPECCSGKLKSVRLLQILSPVFI